MGCWEFCHGQGTGDLLGEENSGRIFCFRIVLAKSECAFEAREKRPFPATRKQQRRDMRSQAKSGLIPLYLWRAPCSCLVYPRPGRKMNEGPPKVPTQQSTGTGCPHDVMTVLVWEMGTWIWQTPRDPSQFPLSSSKAGHVPALPGGEPVRSPPESSATLEDIWSPSQWAKIRKRGKGH